jgi:phage-related protein
VEAREVGDEQEQTGWQLVLYTDIQGQIPVRIYVEALPDEVRRRFQTRVGYLLTDGLNVSQEVAKKLENNLWELRLPHSDGNPRILFFASVGKRMVLLHGFNKQGRPTDKVPESEKLIARKRREDFIARDELEQAKLAEKTSKAKGGKKGKRK